MEWFRWYHGAISDPKWPLIARKSGKNIGTVVSVWAALLEYASQAEPRGSIEGFDCEQIDALFGYEDGTTESVCNAMKRHVTDETNRIVSWSKRQTKRERDDNSTERVRAYRAKKKAQENKADTTEKHDETPCNAIVTPRNAQNRTEQIREYKKEPPISPNGDGEGEDAPTAKTPKKRQAKTQLPLAYSQDFEAAWLAYPRRDRKGAAWAAWEKAIKRNMPVGRMVEIITARKSMRDWQKDGGQFAPHMATWLNQNGWEDEVTDQASTAKPTFDLAAIQAMVAVN